MTTAPSRSGGGGGIYDPSELFDLDDILMGGDSNEMNSSLIHSPIKEEPEYEPDDNRYVHSPVGLPIPSRNGGLLGFPASIKQEAGGGNSPAGGMWGCPLPAQQQNQQQHRTGASIPFPSTPFNTPAQGSGLSLNGLDLKGFLISAGSNSNHLNYDHNPTLPVSIKEELVDHDSEPFKSNFSMFPMEEDDIFQVDKADLIQGPTLAELNANDESLLTDLNFDDFLLPQQHYQSMGRNRMMPNVSTPQISSSMDRFRMAELNAAFSASPSLSHFELQRGRNTGEDDYAQLGWAQLTLEQLPATVELNFGGGGTPFSPDQASSGGSSNPTTTPTVTSPLSASLPANFGQVSLSNHKLTRRTEEGGRVKPPPPYPTSPPHKSTSSALQELLSVRSPARLPSPNPTGSHSPSPTAQRPSYSGGARQRTSGSASGQSIPRSSATLAATNPLLLARLSSSAPAPSVLASPAPLVAGGESTTRWREPRNRLFSTSSLAEEVHGSASSISTGFDSEDDSDHYEDFDDSDSDSGGSDEEGRGEARAGSSSGMTKKERYFWQYNVQAKGPKGQKINLTPEAVDPHVLNKIQDPVFSPYCSVDGIKHSGKARRGDGNDLTPNPRKLHSIGRELDKLNRAINDMTPVSELPLANRPKSRKEKNKLASRACRLKKKAQHEANKVKLYGLEQEHRKLMTAIAQTKLVLVGKYDMMTGSPQPIIPQLPPDASVRVERIAKSMTKVKIAGHSTEFVNRVLERVKSGEPSGGLDEI